MPLYEHVMIARQDLSNTQAEGLIEHFGTVLADNDGKLVDSEYWGVKTMAYKINKNRKGHYAFLRSDAPATAVQEMERLMRLHDDVMRVLTIKVDEHKELPSVQMQKRDERPERGERAAKSFLPVSPQSPRKSSVNWPVPSNAPASSPCCPTPLSKEKAHASYPSGTCGQTGPNGRSRGRKARLRTQLSSAPRQSAVGFQSQHRSL